jgi:hypothetical protein
VFRGTDALDTDVAKQVREAMRKDDRPKDRTFVKDK